MGPELQFKNEVKAVIHRWLEESDLNDFDMVQLTVDALNDFLGERVISFDPDDDFDELLEP